MRRPAALGAVAALAAVAMLLWQLGAVSGFVTDRREASTSSPGLGALFTREVVLLRAGGRACMRPVTFYADTGQARVRMRAPRSPTPRIDLQMRGPGYSGVARIPRLDPQVEVMTAAEFPRPGREVTGELCFRNRGPTPIQLVGTNEGRSLTPVDLRVNGRLKPTADLELVLLKAGSHSLGSRRSELIDRAASLSGGWLPSWVLWPVVLLLAGVPLLVAALFGVSVWRAEGASSARGAREPGVRR